MNKAGIGPHNCVCVITRGKNSGKTCHILRPYCKSATHKRMNYGHVQRSTESKRISKQTAPAHKRSTIVVSTPSMQGSRQGSSNTERQRLSLKTTTADMGHDGGTEGVQARLERLEREIRKRDKPTITFKQYNQYNQQVIFLTPNDDYVQKLTNTFGSLEGAYKYLEQCAHGEINGDIDLFKQIYLADADVPPFFPTKEGNLNLIKSDGSIIQDVAGRNTIKTYCDNSQHAYLHMITNKIVKELQSRGGQCSTINVSRNKGLTLLGDKQMLDCTGKCAALSDSDYQQRLLKRMIDTVSHAIERGTVSSEKDSLMVSLSGETRHKHKLLQLVDV